MILLDLLRKIYVEFAAFWMWVLSMLVNKTVKLEVHGRQHIDRLKKEGKSIIFCFWHNASHPLMYYYRNTETCMLPVNKIPGEVLGAFGRKLGYISFPLKIDGTPAERTETVIKLIKNIKNGHDLAIAVDGPPDEKLYDVKPGAPYMAAKTGMPIIPAGMWAKKAFIMWWRWDKYIIPLPFTRVTIVIGEPIHIERDISKKEVMDGHRKKITEEIHAATDKAREILRKGHDGQ
jgi:lysophospholipid acyltransferase (LPLAT)-like uncharacterized protein